MEITDEKYNLPIKECNVSAVPPSEVVTDYEGNSNEWVSCDNWWSFFRLGSNEKHTLGMPYVGVIQCLQIIVFKIYSKYSCEFYRWPNIKTKQKDKCLNHSESHCTILALI